MINDLSSNAGSCSAAHETSGCYGALSLIYFVRHEPFLEPVGCILQPSQYIYPRHAERLTSNTAALVRVLKYPSSNIGWDTAYADWVYFCCTQSFIHMLISCSKFNQDHLIPHYHICSIYFSRNVCSCSGWPFVSVLVTIRQVFVAWAVFVLRSLRGDSCLKVSDYKRHIHIS